MKSTTGLLLALGCAACAMPSPNEHAATVRSLPGQKPLRAGLVVVQTDRRVAAAFEAPGAAPGGAAPRPQAGTVYRERIVLPSSLPVDALQQTLVDLEVFTDLVPLSFDARGVTSRAAMVQRLQDRLWPTAVAQELDALLVVEGVRDAGLCWSADDESLFSLDTVLWWLCWPAGLWIPDRSYAPDATLEAELFWVGDPRATPLSVDATAVVGPQSLHPWERADAPLLGLVVPPVWLADDPDAVGDAVADWTRSMLPIELARGLKQASLAQSPHVRLGVAVRGERLEIEVESGVEVVEAAITALPRGALAETPAPLPVALSTQQQHTARGTVHRATGALPLATLREAAEPLLRLAVTLASGERVSQTWAWSELAGE